MPLDPVLALKYCTAYGVLYFRTLLGINSAFARIKYIYVFGSNYNMFATYINKIHCILIDYKNYRLYIL